MTEGAAYRPTKRLGRTAGLLYLIVAITGGFAQIVRVNVLDTGSAAETAANVLNSETLYRVSFASDVIAFSAEVALALVVFALLRPVSELLAMLAAFFRLAQAATLGVNLLNQFMVLLLLSGEEYLAALDIGQRQALATLFLEAHAYGYFIGLVFFGLHNIVLGYLVIKSGYLPRVLGFLLMLVVSTGYLVDSFGNFLVEDYPGILSILFVTPAAIVEFAFIFWLIAKGVRADQRAEAPAQAAV